MKLILQIEVKVELPESNNELTPDLLSKLNSIEKERFSDYIIDSGLPALIAENVKGGILSIEYHPQTKKYFAVVDYDVENRLSAQCGSELLEYTRGQISDGVGDNLVQEFQNRYKIDFYMEEISQPEVSLIYR